MVKKMTPTDKPIRTIRPPTPPENAFDFFISPESSTIRAAFYWPSPNGMDGELNILFKGQDGCTKSVYSYKNFPLSIWKDFKAAPSKGQFMIYVRQYEGVRL